MIQMPKLLPLQTMLHIRSNANNMIRQHSKPRKLVYTSSAFLTNSLPSPTKSFISICKVLMNCLLIITILCQNIYFNKFNFSLTHLVGDQKAPPRSSVDAEKSPLLPMTLMESSAATLHESLKVVIDYQTHHRLRESSGILYLLIYYSLDCTLSSAYTDSIKCIIDTCYVFAHSTLDFAGRSFAEDLNDRVQWWSLGQTTVIILVGIGQVLVLRSFFTDRRHGVPTRVFKR